MKLVWKYLKKYKQFIFLNMFSVLGFILIEIGIPTLLAQGINNSFMGYDTNYIISLGLKMFLFAMIGLVLLLLLSYSTDKVTSMLVRDIRNDIFRKIQTYSRDEYEEFGISRLITNTGTDCYTIMQFLTMILRTGIIAPTMFAASFYMIYRQSPNLALITLGAVPLMMIAITFVNRKTRPLSQNQQKGLDNINRNMRESLTGLRVIRAFNNEDFQENRFHNVNESYANISRRMFQMVAFISPLFTIIFCIVMISVVQIGSVQVNNGLIEFGTLAAFIEYVFHALFSFLMLSGVLITYPRFAVAVSRISEVLAAEPTIKANRTEGIADKKLKGVVEFENVSFAYADSSEEPVLENISFTANPGETIAFIGSTGSGKSTLIQLIPRFFDVTEGAIKIDGVNIQDYNIDTLRGNIGFVPQRAVLFSGTIEENLRFGNANATQEQLEHAAEIAQAKDFIESRENGYQDVLAEGGINLSGGQKQRLCIARALSRDVPIYIFDDSFSALDYKTDATLRSRLKDEVKNSTMLIVAQRVGTIMDADKILVINQGKVVGEGTHKELLKTSEIYHEIAASQLSEEELES